MVRVMNNRFTEKAQEAMQEAYAILQAKNHSQMDVEHLLLALLRQKGGTVERIISHIGVDPQVLTRKVDDALDMIPRTYNSGYATRAVQIYITMRAKRLLEVASEEAERINNQFIGTEHLFLAIIADPSGASAYILKEAGIEREAVYKALLEVDEIGDSSADVADRPSSAAHLSTIVMQLAALNEQVTELRTELAEVRKLLEDREQQS